MQLHQYKSHLTSLLNTFIVFFTLLVLLAASYDNRAMPKIRRGFYSSNHIAAAVPLPFDHDAFLALCAAQSNLDFVISRTDLSLAMDMRGIYFSPGQELPPLVSGRFLTQEEMLSTDYLAVIGTNFLEDVYTQDGMDYLDINRTAYQVVGVIGIGEASRLDSIVYLPLGNLIQGQLANGLYDLDSDQYETLATLSPLFNEALMVPATGMQFDPSRFASQGQTLLAVETALNSINNTTRICGALLLSIFLASLFFTASWVRRATPLIRAERVLGFASWQIVWSVWVPYGTTLLVGIALATWLYHALDRRDILLGIPQHWLIGAACGMGVLVTAQIVYLVLRMLSQLEKRA